MLRRFAPQGNLFGNQPDLFATQQAPRDRDDELMEDRKQWEAEQVILFRAELHERLREVREMVEPVWRHELYAAMAMNDFRSKAERLPSGEGIPLYEAFVAELDRLYEVDPNDPYGYKAMEAEQSAIDGSLPGG
jgi:hypothetical protein